MSKLSIANLRNAYLFNRIISDFHSKTGLLVLYGHDVWRKKSSDIIIDLNDFISFIRFCKKQGFDFIDPNSLESLSNRQKAILLTFDDLNKSHLLLLPIINKYRLPVIFFANPKQILTGDIYWWNRVYQGPSSIFKTDQELQKIKKMPNAETYVNKKYPSLKKSFNMPLTTKELKRISNNKLLTIGNHTYSHKILTNLKQSQIKQEVIKGQRLIKKLISYEPSFIAYPNGGTSPEIEQISRAAGIRYGFTTNWRKNLLPIKKENFIHLNRIDLRVLIYLFKAGRL